LHQSFGLIFVVSVCEVVPDPERSFIVRSQIVPNDELLALLVISRKCFGVGVVHGPFQRLFVDISASVADFIVLVEVSFGITSFDLHGLSGHHLDLHFSGTDLILAGIEHVKGRVDVLGDRDAFERALAALVAGAGVVDLRQMDWSDGVYSVEVVLGVDVLVLVSEVSTQDLLSLRGPW